MTIIPNMEIRSGFSPGTMIQLNNTPLTGTINFHIFSSETLTPGFRSSVYHIENAAAGIMANQISCT